MVDRTASLLAAQAEQVLRLSACGVQAPSSRKA
jgi:hypothetical protein